MKKGKTQMNEIISTAIAATAGVAVPTIVNRVLFPNMSPVLKNGITGAAGLLLPVVSKSQMVQTVGITMFATSIVNIVSNMFTSQSVSGIGNLSTMAKYTNKAKVKRYNVSGMADAKNAIQGPMPYRTYGATVPAMDEMNAIQGLANNYVSGLTDNY